MIRPDDARHVRAFVVLTDEKVTVSA